ncbi:hypothetical protein R1sor_018225 [Riccia sorocarpa]|uniref:Uncharacterized protein n=1 Tax=Riccia sorocarpa TaxID=122646 RepID=A0ABD3I968_9MARC
MEEREKGKLRPHIEQLVFAEDTPIEQIIKVGEIHTKGRQKSRQMMKRRLKTMRIGMLGDLRGRPIRRIVTTDKMGVLPDTGQSVGGPSSEAVHLLKEWVNYMTSSGLKITDPGTMGVGMGVSLEQGMAIELLPKGQAVAVALT